MSKHVEHVLNGQRVSSEEHVAGERAPTPSLARSEYKLIHIEDGNLLAASAELNSWAQKGWTVKQVSEHWSLLEKPIAKPSLAARVRRGFVRLLAWYWR